MINYILMGVLIGSIAKDIWNFLFDVSGILEINVDEETEEARRYKVYLTEEMIRNITRRRRVTLAIKQMEDSQE